MADPALEAVRQRNRARLGLADAPLPTIQPAPQPVAMLPGPWAGPTFPGAWTGPTVQARPSLSGVPGMGDPFSLVPAVTITTAFPNFTATYQPGQSQPSQSSGSVVGDWFTAHVFRPEVTVGGVRVAPYDSFEDYSGIASVLSLLAAGVLMVVGGLVVARALVPNRWIAGRAP